VYCFEQQPLGILRKCIIIYVLSLSIKTRAVGGNREAEVRLRAETVRPVISREYYLLIYEKEISVNVDFARGSNHQDFICVVHRQYL
jgi:hypothetical protein